MVRHSGLLASLTNEDEQGRFWLHFKHVSCTLLAGVMSSLPGLLGWFLRYRKWLVIGYAVLLHLLVYSLALSYASCTREASAAKTG